MSHHKTNRQKKHLLIEDSKEVFDQILVWSQQFSLVSAMNSNYHMVQYGQFEWLIAVGNEAQEFGDSPFDELYEHWNEEKDWLFGHLAYDLKNVVEDLSSQNPDHQENPDIHFFIPETVFAFDGKQLVIESRTEKPQEVWKKIESWKTEDGRWEADSRPSPKDFKLTPTLSKSGYLEKIKSLQDHIQLGDIYEVNFCQEFIAEDIEVDPLELFHSVNKKTRAPFSVFQKNSEHYLCSGSPERYLQKKGNKVVSQPIKGTARRSQNQVEDLEVKNALESSIKERAENVMIVDLVRNDLSITAADNSVQVEELFGVYTFPTVHQLISTVSAEIREDSNWGEVLKHSFPMGSMTGAPKVSAMQLIEKYETFKRGVFSGAVGYITPEGDFDFNVVIRSILYNAKTQYLSAPVGGAITILSDPEEEYEECLLKVKAMQEALKNL
ncbi:MAG: anthranilate synthase component I family protein [Schleiferiaceae bacterium]|nr:anthranilate synthase component I family protein [Schleiferiaceae bacterium]